MRFVNNYKEKIKEIVDDRNLTYYIENKLYKGGLFHDWQFRSR